MTREERLVQIKKEREERKAREVRLQEIKNERAAAKKEAAASAKRDLTLPKDPKRYSAVTLNEPGTRGRPEEISTMEELSDMTMQERPARAEVGRQEAAKNTGSAILEWLAKIGKSGDSSLPMNNATQVINDIRDNREEVQRAVDSRTDIEAQKKMQEDKTKQWAGENKAGATIASVVSSPLSMVDYLQQLIEINAVGHSLPSADLKPAEITQSLRSGASEDMSEAGKFLYNTAMSGVDSLVAGALSGGTSGVGAFILGGAAASSTMNDIKQRGGNDQQAILGGAAAGAFETIFEKLSLGQLNALKEMPVDGAKTFLKNIAKSVFTNASEEAATELANGLFDSILMQDLANYDLKSTEGRTELAKQVGLSALAGGLMGAAFGGIGSAAGAVNNRTFREEAQAQLKEESELVQTPAVKPARTFQEEVHAQIFGEEGTAEGSGKVQNAPALTERQGQAGVENVQTHTETTAENVAQNAIKSDSETTVGVHDLRTKVAGQTLQSLMGDEEVEWLDRLSRVANVPINIVDGRQGTDGWYRNGQLYISGNAQDPFRVVAKHELTHHLQQTAPEQYAQFRSFAENYLKQETVAAHENFEDMVGQLQEQYAQQGVELDRDGVIDEMAADFAGRLLVDESMFRRIAAEDRNLAQRLLDGLREFLQKVRGVLEHRQVTELEHAAQLWETALRESVRNGRVSEDSGTRYMFAGGRARTADVNAQRDARALEAAGEDGEAVRQATGWYRGADGQWRFEIDDSQAKYYPAGDARFRTDHPQYARHQELTEKMLTGDISAQEVVELQQLEQIWGRERSRLKERVDAGNATLENILDHPALFEAYPELRGVAVKFKELPKGTRGQYSKNRNTITLDLSLRSAPMETLIHEIQHAIQSEEGFSPGGSREYWSRELESGGQIYSKGMNEALSKLTAFEADPENQAVVDMSKRMDEALRADDNSAAYDALYAEAERLDLMDKIAEYDDLRGEFYAQKSRPGNRVPSELYEDTAGEIEARDAAARRGLTADRRRATAPDIGNENTVFATEDRADEYIGGEISEEEQKDGIQAVAKMEPVIEISGNEFEKSEVDLITQVTRFFDSLGNQVFNPQLGDVVLDRKGVKDDFGHGIGRKKAAAFAAVPDVLKQGRVIDYQKNWKGRGYDTAVVAAPVKIGGENYLEGIVLTRGDETNRFYVHEVLAIENNNGALPFKTGTSSRRGLPSGDAPSVISLLQIVRDVNTDKQYSIQGTSELQRQVADLAAQNKRLEERNKRLKEQMKRSGRATTDEAEVKRAAAQLLKDFNSKYSKAELSDRLQRLYDSMAEPGQVESMSGDEIHREARNIAESILSEVSVLNDDLYQEYGDLRKYLRTTKIHVPQDLWGELEIAGGYNEFRKRNMGRLNLSSVEGRGVDDVYQELSYDYPGLFDQDAVNNPGDQLLQIADVLDSLRPAYENPYAADQRNAANWLAGEIMERFYDLRQTPATFADRAYAKVTAAHAQGRTEERERFKKALEAQEKRNQKRLDAIKESNRQANARMRERMTTTKLRDTIKRHAEGLSRKLLRPTDKQHIPEKLRGSVLALLEVIDLESKYGYEFTKDAEFRRVNRAEGGNLEPTKRTAAARALADAYAELHSDPDFNGSIDPDLVSKLEKIADMGDIRVADMSREQLQTVWEAVRAVESSVTKADKMLGESKYAKISAAADQLRGEVGDRKDRRNLVGALGKGDQLINLDMLTPETFFHRLGTVGEDVYRQMRRAQDKSIRILDEGIEFYKRAAEQGSVDLLKAEKEIHTFELPGGTIELSTAQVMELYALSHRQQAMDHIYKGGLRAKGAQKGIFKAGKSEPVKVSYYDVADILEILTPEQKAFVDKLQEYMSTQLAAHGNEASMEAYGYEKFKEKKYWPIKVSGTETDSDPAQEARAKTIPGFGMTKTLQPHANNSVTLRSALDTYSEHLNQMATYAGWLTTSENITKLMNYDYLAEGKRTGTVKALFEKVYGEGGVSYLTNLLSDVAQGSKTGTESTFADTMLGRFKAAKVGANLRVILQQPTALLRAMELINANYLASGGNPLKGWQKAKQWSQIAKWKDWGYFEMDAGKSMRELMVGTKRTLDKVKNFTMSPAGKMDNFAWGVLWNAVEAETMDLHEELKPGTDEFYQKVAERFGEVIDRTQVVDSVLHRTQIMRSGNAFNRLSTSFMSEPSKVYNMVARDIYDLAHSEKGSADHKRAVKHVGRTGVALIGSFAVNAVAQSLMDAMRDDDRDKEYGEKFVESYWKNFSQNFAIWDYVPYLKDIASIIEGFSVERSDMEGVADLVNAFKTLGKVIDGTSTKTGLNAGMELTVKALDAFGLPGSNIKRDIVGVLSTTLQACGADWMTYQMDKLLLDIKHSSNSSVYYDTLYRTMGRDWDTYVRIYQDMVDSGMEPDKIAAAMEKRMAESIGLKKASSLPFDYAAPGEDKTFDQIVREQIAGTYTWEGAIGAEQIDLARQLEWLQPEAGEKSVTNAQRLREIADSVFGEEVKEVAVERYMGKTAYECYMAARRSGVSTYEFVNLLEDVAAATKERTGKDGTASQADVLQVLKRSALTSAQKRAIWYGYGYKSESPWG